MFCLHSHQPGPSYHPAMKNQTISHPSECCFSVCLRHISVCSTCSNMFGESVGPYLRLLLVTPHLVLPQLTCVLGQ